MDLMEEQVKIVEIMDILNSLTGGYYSLVEKYKDVMEDIDSVIDTLEEKDNDDDGDKLEYYYQLLEDTAKNLIDAYDKLVSNQSKIIYYSKRLFDVQKKMMEV